MNRPFFIGLISGGAIFITINLLAAHLASDCGLPAVFGRGPCADDIVRLGWPIQFYEEGGFIFRLRFYPMLWMIDLWIGTAFSLLCGWIFKKTLPK